MTTEERWYFGAAITAAADLEHRLSNHHAVYFDAPRNVASGASKHAKVAADRALEMLDAIRAEMRALEQVPE